MIDLFLLLWGAVTLLTAVSLTALWQLKEYRWDRMKVFFFEQSGLSIFYRLPTRLLMGLLVIMLLEYLIEFPIDTLRSFWLPMFCTALFAAEVLEIIGEVVRRKFVRPRMTFKALVLILGSVCLQFLLLFSLWVFDLLPQESFELFLVVTFVYLLQSDVHAVLVFILNKVTRFLQRRTFERARRKRLSFPKLQVIGITGSYGKSTVKELLAHVLSKKFQVLKTPKNINAEIGIAQFLLSDLKSEHEVFVCEMGAYVGGEIRKSCHIAKPQRSVITGLNEQHQALFGGIDNTFKAKWEIVSSLPKNGKVYLNGESKELMKRRIHSEAGQEVVTLPQEVHHSLEKKELSFSFDYKGYHFEVPLIGSFHSINVMIVIQIALDMGMTLQEISEALPSFQSAAKSDTKLLRYQQGMIFDRSYNSNTDAVKSFLEHLEGFEKPIALVFPGIIELGEEGKDLHEELGRYIGDRVERILIPSLDYAEDLVRGLKKSSLEREKILVSTDFEEQKRFFEDFLDDDEKWYLVFEGRGARKLREYLEEKSSKAF